MAHEHDDHSDDEYDDEGEAVEVDHAAIAEALHGAVERGDVKLHAWTYSLDDSLLYFFDSARGAFTSSADAANQGGTGQMTLDEIEREDNVK